MKTPNEDRSSILVVDDTPANLQLLVGMLSEHGYRVRPVTNGSHALKAVRLDPPDLILLDISMPEMDGFEVCRRLKEDPTTHEIPVLFISAHTDTEDKVRAFEAGGVDYVSKPFQLAEVAARVRTHLKLRQRERELEAALARERELEQLRDKLTHMVAHDMRSPLLALQLIMDMLHSSVSTPECKELFLTAQSSVGSLIELVTQMIDVSRMEAGALKPVLTMLDLAEAARDVLKTMRPLAVGIDLLLEAADEVKVSADADLIRRVIANLVGNACKFSTGQGRVTVRVQQLESCVRVEVVDNGCGIAAADHARIFEKFGQVSGNRCGAGSGLGLTFAKMAVEAHGGAIGVISALGQGSTFWFTLPLVALPVVPFSEHSLSTTP